eukprot:Seg229.5 transcript_id=Seg229.5/GoldUCD/mRNA.D3Y31 product="Synaptotagmin 1" pseudo=true protein_id=Seg229.5/GoldUCD/D3Y31
MEIKRFSNSTDVVFSFAAKDEKKEHIIISYCKKLWKLLEKLPIPPIATLSIAGAILLLFFICCCCCCCRLCCRRKKKEDDKDSDGEESVDLGTVELIETPVHEKKQPTFDEMDYSVAGFCEEEELEGTVLGRVLFSMKYLFEEQSLSITIFEANDLPSADEDTGTSDPYIRVMLLPDTKRRFETLVLDKTLDPVYNQTFVFKNVPYNEVQNRTMCIQALDFDAQAQHDVLGEAKLPLIDINLNVPLEKEWRILVPGYDGETGEFRKSTSDYGEICVSLRYIPTTKKLLVFLLECQNLKSTDPGGVSDPYVRITLFEDGKKVKLKKSTVKKQTLNPYYNEQFYFIVAPEKIEKSAIEFMVMDYDLIGKADVIGQIRIGAGTYGPQLRHWRDMLRNPRKPMPQWHMLRPKSKKGEED